MKDTVGIFSEPVEMLDIRWHLQIHYSNGASYRLNTHTQKKS